MYVTVHLPCGATTNTFYIVPPLSSTILGAHWSANANPGSNKSVAISLNGGNDIVTGNISTSPGTITTGTVTAVAADKIQVVSPSTTKSISVIATTSNACNLSLTLDLDEFTRKD